MALVSTGGQLDILTIGRTGVDIYPLEIGRRLEDVTTFGKFLGGSATNVAVAAARLGHATAVITGVGDDPFGRFVRREMRALGVDDRHTVVNTELHTPVTFCEMFPPDDFPLWFYRAPSAPDLEITAADLDLAAIAAARLFWVTATGFSKEPSRSTHHIALAARGRRRHTVLDLDYRSTLWPAPAAARREILRVLDQFTVVVGNREECEVAVGESDPERAADALLDHEVELAVVKKGPDGVLAKSREGRVEVSATKVDIVNGLGAGDAFGGALCHGLLADWSLQQTIAFASAAGALVASRLECATAMPTAAEINELLNTTTGTRPSGGPRPQRNRTLMERDDLDMVVRTRRDAPHRIAERLRERTPAPPMADDQKLLIIAADHPARGALSVGGDPMAMGDRSELLARITTALGRPGVHGFLGTADLIEDLALLDALDGKVVFGSMDRGGLAGASFEIDDRFTGYDARGIEQAGLSGGKMLLRIDDSDTASASTIQACARAVDALADRRLVALVEPFMSRRVDGRQRNILTADAAIRSIAITSGLGRTSAYTWLKLPVVDQMERVLAAATLPVLILGGDVSDDTDAVLSGWESSLAYPNVHGLVVGRSLLFPPGGDVAAAVDAAAGVL